MLLVTPQCNSNHGWKHALSADGVSNKLISQRYSNFLRKEYCVQHSLSSVLRLIIEIDCDAVIHENQNNKVHGYLNQRNEQFFKASYCGSRIVRKVKFILGWVMFLDLDSFVIVPWFKSRRIVTFIAFSIRSLMPGSSVSRGGPCSKARRHSRSAEVNTAAKG